MSSRKEPLQAIQKSRAAAQERMKQFRSQRHCACKIITLYIQHDDGQQHLTMKSELHDHKQDHEATLQHVCLFVCLF